MRCETLYYMDKEDGLVRERAEEIGAFLTRLITPDGLGHVSYVIPEQFDRGRRAIGRLAGNQFSEDDLEAFAALTRHMLDVMEIRVGELYRERDELAKRTDFNEFSRKAYDCMAEGMRSTNTRISIKLDELQEWFYEALENMEKERLAA